MQAASRICTFRVTDTAVRLSRRVALTPRSGYSGLGWPVSLDVTPELRRYAVRGQPIRKERLLSRPLRVRGESILEQQQKHSVLVPSFDRPCVFVVNIAAPLLDVWTDVEAVDLQIAVRLAVIRETRGRSWGVNVGGGSGGGQAGTTVLIGAGSARRPRVLRSHDSRPVDCR